MIKDRAGLAKIMEELEQTSEKGGLQALSEKLRDFLGVDHLVYHWVNSDGEQYGCGTYSDEWVQRYVEKGYLRIDPVITGCFQRFHAVDWKKLNWTGKPAKQFLKEAIEFGVGNQGFSVPIRGPNGQFALFSVSHQCADDAWEAFVATIRYDLILIAHFFNQKALEFEPDRLPDSAPALSPREVEVMTLLALGYSRAQVAENLSISEHTLRVYVESARFKLGAVNTVNAVARALSRGLIIV